jgi:hypothetical protein
LKAIEHRLPPLACRSGRGVGGEGNSPRIGIFLPDGMALECAKQGKGDIAWAAW